MRLFYFVFPGTEVGASGNYLDLPSPFSFFFEVVCNNLLLFTFEISAVRVLDVLCIFLMHE